VRPAPDLWPVWATVGHTTGAHVYWLCGVLGEPGAETTPFTDAVSGVGWEDDENIPRGAQELVMALETTWRLVDRCLDRWTPAMLGEAFVREYEGDRRSSAMTPITVASSRRPSGSTDPSARRASSYLRQVSDV
jgi:hypothetical protein